MTVAEREGGVGADVELDAEAIETVAGVDVGTDYTQAVIVRGDDLLAVGETKTGFELQDAADRALVAARERIDGSASVDAVVAVGDRPTVDADRFVPTYEALASGLEAIRPDARSVLLMGAKNVAALRLDEDGTVAKSVENGKCAAGVGRFLADLTRYLEMDLDEMIEAALAADEGVDDLNAQCSVFAESEVISLVHEGVPPERIVRGVFEAVAGRNGAMLRRVGFEDEVVVIGGVGRNEAFLEALSAELDTAVHAPPNPAYVPAYGAALASIGGDGS